LNLIPGYWVPASSTVKRATIQRGAKNQLAFKGPDPHLGLTTEKDGQSDELTHIRVDSVQDDSASAQDATPLAAEREWQQQAEDNVVERLQRSGCWLPQDVDKILQRS